MLTRRQVKLLEKWILSFPSGVDMSFFYSVTRCRFASFSSESLAGGDDCGPLYVSLFGGIITPVLVLSCGGGIDLPAEPYGGGWAIGGSCA